MQIYGPTQVHGPQAINSPHAARHARPATPPAAAAHADELQISDAAQLAARLSEIPDVRSGRVAEIRAAIASGTYETEAKLSRAVDALLDEMA